MDRPSLSVHEVIPSQILPVFPFDHFNPMQSRAFHHAFDTDENVVVAAPSGSGKTVIMELAICRAYLQFKSQGFRCVYIAPSKALCQQRWVDWQIRFSKIGLTVLELTGDSDVQDCLNQISKASIIITTPEKWDCLTRCWRNHTFLLCGINLLMLDEIHHLAEEERGGILEAVIVRMMLVAKTKNIASQYSLRIVALSATLPNIVDVGLWLGCRQDSVLQFDESYRPVPLEVKTVCYPNKSNPFMFERSLEPRVKEIIERYSDGKQCIIFCSSKKNAENQTVKLSEQHTLPFQLPPEVIKNEISKISNESLRGIVYQGYGFHHSGLTADDRTIVEHLFKIGFVKILCSTTTLAQGMNLPAHLVVIKGTHSWRGAEKGYLKLSRSDVIQMLGRAGRPGYDVHGKAVIMTSKEDEAYYGAIGLSADVVESKLKSMLIEAVAAEISQKTITSFNDCVVWMKSTLYSIRYLLSKLNAHFDTVLSLLKSLKRTMNEETANEMAEKELSEISKKVLSSLCDQQLIEFLDETAVAPLEDIHIMSRNLTKFSSMVLLLKMGKNADILSLLKTISECEENHRAIRKSDKKVLNGFAQFIRFPTRDKIQAPSQKAFVLLQAIFSDKCAVVDFNLKIEQAEIVYSSLRLLKTLREMSISKGWGRTLESTILLDRGLNMRLWEWKHSNFFLQCPNVTPETVRKMGEHGKNSFHAVDGMSAAQLARQLDCSQDDAANILQFASMALKSKFDLRLNEREPSNLEIKIEKKSEHADSWQLNFELVCYNSVTGDLICHRTLPHMIENKAFSVNLKHRVEISQIKCGLYASVAGLDSILYPKSSVPSTEANSPENGSSNPKKRRKTEPVGLINDANPFEAYKLRNPSLPIFPSNEKQQQKVSNSQVASVASVSQPIQTQRFNHQESPISKFQQLLTPQSQPVQTQRLHRQESPTSKFQQLLTPQSQSAALSQPAQTQRLHRQESPISKFQQLLTPQSQSAALSQPAQTQRLHRQESPTSKFQQLFTPRFGAQAKIFNRKIKLVSAQMQDFISTDCCSELDSIPRETIEIPSSTMTSLANEDHDPFDLAFL